MLKDDDFLLLIEKKINDIIYPRFILSHLENFKLKDIYVKLT